MSKKINALFVAEEIYPDAIGGVHTYIYNIAKGLTKKGHKVTILTRLIKSNLPQEEEMDGFKVYRYGFKDYSFSLAKQFSCILNIRKKADSLLKKNNFDLINLHSPQAALGVNLSKKSKGIPKIYTFYALQHKEDLLSAKAVTYQWHQWRRYLKPFWLVIYLGLMQWLEKMALTRAQKIIVLSDYTAGCLAKVHGISPDKAVKAPGGVDMDLFKPEPDKNRVRQTLNIPANKQVLFTLRRLVPRMGLDNLIKAMPAIIEKHPDVLLLIGGKGPLESELKSLIEELNLTDFVKLLGCLDQDKAPLYCQAADLFILPTKALEGFGIVTLEALACGTPVLGTPVGGTAEILSKLDKELLFKGTDPGSIAGLILRYLEDPGKLGAIREKAHRFIVDNYSWDKSAAKTEKLFFEALKI